ncbi:hypothetical protein [Nitrosomonas supralitoralis]|uniref:Uncharacterized protein n=1 Tax=Nitrosomonas supralitoralis TaxID=2116706 RepID=A0A2P7NUD1_9PROT|nr:hypothetical protein [Nitrosomonas supralitoralis]PSJ17082.1 hypothetical protein C7H79_10215 [Nitrosomonas supralitoralis]
MITKPALKLAVRKRAPSKISLSGDAARNNDFLSVYLVYENEEWGLLVEDISQEGIVGKSPLRFLLSKLLFTNKFFVAKDKLEQFIFNRKTLVRHH